VDHVEFLKSPHEQPRAVFLTGKCASRCPIYSIKTSKVNTTTVGIRNEKYAIHKFSPALVN